MRTGDAFGQALYDHLRLAHGIEIIERSDGFIQVGPGPEAYFAPFRKWGSHERAAMRYVRGRVLDIGCGAGRHALHLQERGHDVLGIDVSPLAVRVAKARGLKKTRVLALERVSPRLGRFDTVLLMGGNFGLLRDRRSAPRLLRRLHAVTSERGRIIAATLDPRQTNEPAHRTYHEWNLVHGRMLGQIRMRVRYRELATPWFDYLFVSPDELAALVRGTGWRVRRLLWASVRRHPRASPAYIAILDKD